MVHIRRSRHPFWRSRFWNMVLGGMAGLSVLLLCMVLCALLMTYMDASEAMVQAMAMGSLCAGSYTAGCTAAKRQRQKGLLTGVICGMALYFVIMAAGWGMFHTFAIGRMLIRFCMTAIFGGVGGVVGVNTKQQKPPR